MYDMAILAPAKSVWGLQIKVKNIVIQALDPNKCLNLTLSEPDSLFLLEGA